MEKPTYSVKVSDDGFSYFFDSISESQTIKKAVKYLPTNGNSELYQLMFGNILPDGEIDVFAVSNNDDMELILSTVISSVELFFDKFPDKIIGFSGSTPARTRLYRAAIAKFAQNKELAYHIFGLTDSDELEIFDKNHSYSGYIIQKKQ